MRRLLIILLFALSFGGIWSQLAVAQEADNAWSSPYRLSSGEGEASEGFMVADDYGFLHVFWIEEGIPQSRPIIQYARFDGRNWSIPVDIRAAEGFTIGYVSPYIDEAGIIHLMWTEGNAGPVYYMQAPAYDALSAQKWSQPIRIDVSAFELQLQIDSQGIYHLVYSDFYGADPGVYYVQSLDQGETWSFPIWLDPDIPASYAPFWMRFVVDDSDRLHITWSYMDVFEAINKWVRYTRSLDGGTNWSAPATIDEAINSEFDLRMANPGMAVSGDAVHVVWAGTAQTNRKHRYSLDGGETWEPARRIFGELHGQAAGDGLVVDVNGRIHFASHIRHPSAIWHTYWDEDHWSNLEAVNPSVAINPHFVRLAIRGDNQLIMTFKPESDATTPLYAIYRNLDDLPASEILPTPSPTAVVKPTITATPLAATATPIPDFARGGDVNPFQRNETAYSFWVGTVISLSFVTLVVGAEILLRRGR